MVSRASTQRTLNTRSGVAHQQRTVLPATRTASFSQRNWRRGPGGRFIRASTNDQADGAPIARVTPRSEEREDGEQSDENDQGSMGRYVRVRVSSSEEEGVSMMRVDEDEEEEEGIRPYHLRPQR